MKERIISGFTVVLLAIFCYSCNLESLDDPIIVADIEDEFYLDFWENLFPTQRRFQLNIETITKEECLNVAINYDYSRAGNTMELSLADIASPEDCLIGEAPAMASVNIGELPEGFYELTIDLKQTVFNEGQLTVTPESYTINMKTESGIVFLRRQLMRVPDQTLWGYIGRTEEVTESVANDFLGDLSELGNPRNFTPGYYGFFNLDAEQKITIADLPFPTERVHTFIMEYSGENTSMEELINTYRETYGERITIQAFNAKGEVF